MSKIDKIIKRIFDYRGELERIEKVDDIHTVSREEFTFLLGGMPSFRKVPGINGHMGFDFYYCDEENNKQLVKEHLKNLFGVEDKKSLVEACYNFFPEGNQYEQFMTFWKNAPKFDISALEPQGLKAFEECKYRAGYFYPFLQEKGFYAYDISERIVLCQTAVTGGIISEEEFFEITDEWVRLAQVFYNSYAEFAISYLCGAVYFELRSVEDNVKEFVNISIKIFDMLLKNNGAWQVNSWYTPKEREWVDLVGHNLGCFVTRKAMENGFVGYMYHDEPSENNPDSGWRFMYGDEDDEYLSDVNNTTILALNTVCNLQPDILAFIYAEEGREFEMDITGWVEILE
ncbi:MAG: DUF2185 domain-containing protein [Lachnospiraceae bacterium]|nr:DUF2185 domain-containing protein [Lachnospiraceae bacterium]